MGGMQPGIPKPNPYVIAETKRGDEQNTEVTFKYPRSKIFVGGLDFKLTVDEKLNALMGSPTTPGFRPTDVLSIIFPCFFCTVAVVDHPDIAHIYNVGVLRTRIFVERHHAPIRKMHGARGRLCFDELTFGVSGVRGSSWV